jgi:uncharacterized damage-inducible protein DinB
MEITTAESFLQYYDKVHERTRKAVDQIPPERLEWTYREGKFTLGDLVRHLAAINRYMFAEVAMRRPNRYPGHGRELADGYAAVVEYFERMHAETVKIIGAMTEADLKAKCETPAGFPMSAWKWLRSMVEHEIHHRGQIYTYLGMMEVSLPPLYGMTSEQVRAQAVES